MVSITLPPSQIVLRNSIKLFEHWLRCYYLLTIPNVINLKDGITYVGAASPPGRKHYGLEAAAIKLLRL